MHVMQIHNTDGQPFYLHAKSCTDGDFRATRVEVRAVIRRSRAYVSADTFRFPLLKIRRNSPKHGWLVPSTEVMVETTGPVCVRLGCHTFDSINSLALLTWAGLRPQRASTGCPRRVK